MYKEDAYLQPLGRKLFFSLIRPAPRYCEGKNKREVEKHMKETIKVCFYALKLGIKTGYSTFLNEIWKYRSFKEMQRRRVF